MFLWTIASKALGGHLELSGAITKGHETQDPKKDTDSFSADIFDSSNIHGLTIVAKPVPKVDLED